MYIHHKNDILNIIIILIIINIITQLVSCKLNDIRKYIFSNSLIYTNYIDNNFLNQIIVSLFKMVKYF